LQRRPWQKEQLLLATSDNLTCIMGNTPMQNKVFDAYTNLLRMINPRCLIAAYAESKQMTNAETKQKYQTHNYRVHPY
jgi:hypothetical protein